jgi:hypothetical protein
MSDSKAEAEAKAQAASVVECMAAFKKLSTRKLRYITYKITDFKVLPESEGDVKTATMLDFKKLLPDTEPRYAVYDLEFNADPKYERLTSKMYFIFWNPPNASTSEKVVYAQALNDFRLKFNGTTNKDCMNIKDVDELLRTEYIKGKGNTVPQDAASDSEESEEDFD